MTLRPQAHEIIRTWAFYTIVKAWYHSGRLPWSEVLISGWGLAGEGMAKLSKSRSSGMTSPQEMIARTSADALRYWAASTGPGKDAIVSEEKIELGQKLVTKLWNVARFAEPFLRDLPEDPPAGLTPADRWIRAALGALIERVSAAFEGYEYAQARAEVETFFWRDLADNYIEMAKLRLYDPAHPAHLGARQTLRLVLRDLLKLFAPLLPYVTETIWQALFSVDEGEPSIHRAAWPEPAPYDPADLARGERLVEIATAARRHKSERALSLGSPLARVILTAPEEEAGWLREAAPDITSVTRANGVAVAVGDWRLAIE
jgi:valyl-tRNA synthetase